MRSMAMMMSNFDLHCQHTKSSTPKYTYSAELHAFDLGTEACGEGPHHPEVGDSAAMSAAVGSARTHGCRKGCT